MANNAQSNTFLAVTQSAFVNWHVAFFGVWLHFQWNYKLSLVMMAEDQLDQLSFLIATLSNCAFFFDTGKLH